MKTSVNLILCDGDPEDSLAEIRLEDANVLPTVGDIVEFDSLDDDPPLTGRVTSRVFRLHAFGREVDVIVEPEH